MYFCDKILAERDGLNNYRIPSVITTEKGTVLAFFNNRIGTLDDHSEETRLVLCRKEAGKEWETLRTIAAYPGCSCMIDTAVYDEQTGTALCLFYIRYKPLKEFGNYTEEERLAAKKISEEAARQCGMDAGNYAAVSSDEGLTWNIRKIAVLPNRLGYTASPHGSGAGITLKHSLHKGRLVCPARYSTGTYSDREGLKIHCFNSAIYSDDHGNTWKTAMPVQQGTGEGTLAELPDGRIYYNSRAYFDDNARYIAWSHDGGESFGEFKTEPQLIEPRFGCNASLMHVCYEGKSVLVFANPRHLSERVQMTLSVSFDHGETWKAARCVNAGPSAYSSLGWSEAEKRFFLLYETGKEDAYEGFSMAEFDMEWLLEGYCSGFNHPAR